jgi:hypothetical protein
MLEGKICSLRRAFTISRMCMHTLPLGYVPGVINAVSLDTGLISFVLSDIVNR